MLHTDQAFHTISFNLEWTTYSNQTWIHKLLLRVKLATSKHLFFLFILDQCQILLALQLILMQSYGWIVFATLWGDSPTKCWRMTGQPHELIEPSVNLKDTMVLMVILIFIINTWFDCSKCSTTGWMTIPSHHTHHYSVLQDNWQAFQGVRHISRRKCRLSPVDETFAWFRRVGQTP